MGQRVSRYLDTKIVFQRRAVGADGYGNERGSFADFFATFASVREALGNEVVAAGRLGELMTATVLVRASSNVLGLTTEDRALMRGGLWDVRSIARVERLPRMIEILLQKGGAQ